MRKLEDLPKVTAAVLLMSKSKLPLKVTHAIKGKVACYRDIRFTQQTRMEDLLGQK